MQPKASPVIPGSVNSFLWLIDQEYEELEHHETLTNPVVTPGHLVSVLRLGHEEPCTSHEEKLLTELERHGLNQELDLVK